MNEVHEIYKLDLPIDDNIGNLAILNICISAAQVSGLIKEKFFKKNEYYKDKLFYPIKIRQNEDLSFDILFGVLEPYDEKTMETF